MTAPRGHVGPRRIGIAPWRLDLTVRPGVIRVVPGSILARLVRAALQQAGAPAPASIGLILSDDAELRRLNARAFGRRRPTDVLSFPLLPESSFSPHAGDPGRGGAGEEDGDGTTGVSGGTSARGPIGADGRPARGATGVGGATETDSAPRFVLPPRVRPHLGDIVVSVERAVAQACEGRGGHEGSQTWAPADELRLLVLHGTLHLCGWDHADPAEAAAMRSLEERLLGEVPAARSRVTRPPATRP